MDLTYGGGSDMLGGNMSNIDMIAQACVTNSKSIQNINVSIENLVLVVTEQKKWIDEQNRVIKEQEQRIQRLNKTVEYLVHSITGR